MERVRPNTPALPGISISEPSSSLFLVIGDNEWVSLPASFLRSRKVLGAGGCLIASFHAARCIGECSTVQTQTQRGALPVAPRCVILGLPLLYRKSLDLWSKGCESFRVVMLSAIRKRGVRHRWSLDSWSKGCESFRVVVLLGDCANSASQSPNPDSKFPSSV